MKILYILELNIYKQSGILNKVNAQIAEWIKDGHETQVVVFSPPSQNEESLIKGAIVLSNQLVFKLLGISSIGLWINKAVEIFNFKTIIDEFNSDVIYFRQTIWTPFFPFSFRKYTSVIELNTLDRFEIKHINKLWQWVYMFGKSFVIKYIDGIISVSNEIKKDYKLHSKKKNIPSIVLSNSIQGLQPLPFTGSSRAVLVFVGSEGMTWHGTDKLELLAKELPEYDIWLIGEKINSNYINLITSPFLNRDELMAVYRKSDIGIASLALYRNKMNEASPLKVREYLAYGLPVIGGYFDTDFSGKDFYLELENTENNIENSIKEIREFVEKWKGKRVNHKSLKPYTFKEKEKERLAFFKTVVDGKN